MAGKLDEVRVQRDQMTERIVSGLKDRSRYALSEGVFTQEFCEGKTWFEYRLLKEQSLDAEFGRYEFEGQHPIFFSRTDLARPKKTRTDTKPWLKQIEIDVGAKVVGLYREILAKICGEGEDIFNYGEVTKLDANNALTLYERICCIGQKVAQGKIDEISNLPYLDVEFIKSKIIRPDIEERVINNAVSTAERYLLPNPEIMRQFFRSIIDLTVEVELDYIEKFRKRSYTENKFPMGWGQVEPPKIEPPFSVSPMGWGIAR